MRCKDETYESQLEELRTEIAACDRKILQCVMQRLQYVERVGELKMQNRCGITDSVYEKKVFARNKEYARKLGMSYALCYELTKLLLKFSYKKQQRICDL